MRGEMFCSCRWIPVKDRLSPEHKDACICQWRTGRLQSKFLGNCATPGLSWKPVQGFVVFNPSGRPLIQFVANAASSRVLNLARSRESLISAYCRHGGARNEITFAFPRIERTCHSVGTTCSRGRYELKWLSWIAKIMENPPGFLATKEGVQPPNLS